MLRIDDIEALFLQRGQAQYSGEPVTQLQHAKQAAALAEAEGADDELVTAALLHDLGHLLGLMEPGKYERMGDCGVMCHEGIGAAFLERRGFPQATCDIVRHHVQAKRYLTCRDKGYFDRLSSASRTTLGYQGGPMTEAEAREFEADPGHRLVLLMRTWDEAAKVPGAAVPGFDAHRDMLERIVRENIEAKESAAAS